MKVYSTNGEAALIQERREIIASLLCRGVNSLRRISDELDAIYAERGDAPGHSHVTVRKDIQAIEAEWRKRCAATVDAHRARLLACYWDVYQAARDARDLSAALAALGAIGAMLGTAAAPKAPLGPDGKPVLYIVGVPEGAV